MRRLVSLNGLFVVALLIFTLAHSPSHAFAAPFFVEVDRGMSIGVASITDAEGRVPCRGLPGVCDDLFLGDSHLSESSLVLSLERSVSILSVVTDGSLLPGMIAEGSIQTDAALGLLRGRVFGNTTVRRVRGATPSGAIPLNSAATNSREAMHWGDTFTITSSVLPTGTMVPVTAKLTISSTVQTTGGDFNAGSGSPRPFVFGAFSSLHLDAGRLGFLFPFLKNQVRDLAIPQSQTLTQTASETILLPVGFSFSVDGTLEINELTASRPTIADIKDSPVTVTAFTDALDTAIFNIDIGNPDATYITASGTTYFTTTQPTTSVPEPSTALLFGCSLIGAGMTLRWRRPSFQSSQ